MAGERIVILDQMRKAYIRGFEYGAGRPMTAAELAETNARYEAYGASKVERG